MSVNEHGQQGEGTARVTAGFARKAEPNPGGCDNPPGSFAGAVEEVKPATMETVIDAGTNRQLIKLADDLRQWDEFVKSPRGRALLHKDYVREHLARNP